MAEIDALSDFARLEELRFVMLLALMKCGVSNDLGFKSDADTKA